MKLQVPDFCTAHDKIFNVVNAAYEAGGGLVLLEGSRGSGKSYGGFMMGDTLLSWGYSPSMTNGLITQSKLSDSIIALQAEILQNYIASETKDTMTLSTGHKRYFQGFHPSRKSALKGGNRAGKILIIDEVENWQEKAAMDTINTYIRFGGIIILISNHFPQYIMDIYQAFRENGKGYYARIDYWENEYLDPTTRKIWDSLKEQNEPLWRSRILYDEVDEYSRLFSPNELESMFDQSFDTDTKPMNKSIGIDVALGGVDFSVISRAVLGDNTHVYVQVGAGFQLELNALVGRAMSEINEFKPYTEVWDYNGQGMGAVQARGRHDGLIEFMGQKESTNPLYSNWRTEAYGYLEELARDGRLHLIGTPAVLAKLREDLRAQVLGKDRRDGKLALADKNTEIRKILGRSCDYSDSVSMAVWGLKKELKKIKTSSMIKSNQIIKTKRPSWLTT